MDEDLILYLAKKFMGDLRNGDIPEITVIKKLHVHSVVNNIRKIVEEDDVKMIMELITKEREDIGNFLLALLRNYDTRQDVYQFIIDLWDKAETFERRHALMWLILDNNVSDSINRSMYELVRENIIKFMAINIAWYGGADNIIYSCEKRLKDNTFPREKDWTYLVVMLVSPDKESVKKIYKQYFDSDNVFTAAVAKDLYNILEHNL